MSTKQQIITALQTFIAQRAGIDPRNYGDWKSYKAEARSVTQDRHDAERLLAQVELRDSITADDILAAARGGRLDIKTNIAAGTYPETMVRVDYCTGQYFPTEYRKAAARLMSSVLWAHVRDWSMPTARDLPPAPAVHLDTRTGKYVPAGDWLRAYFKRAFGRRIADRYFN